MVREQPLEPEAVCQRGQSDRQRLRENRPISTSAQTHDNEVHQPDLRQLDQAIHQENGLRAQQRREQGRQQVGHPVSDEIRDQYQPVRSETRIAEGLGQACRTRQVYAGEQVRQQWQSPQHGRRQHDYGRQTRDDQSEGHGHGVARSALGQRTGQKYSGSVAEAQ